MIYSILQLVKRVFRFFGMEISFYNPGGSYIKQLIKSFDLNNIDLIIDIGANNGQFASDVFNAGYKGKIISIEPLKESHLNLLKSAAKNNNWIVLPRMALGNKTKETYINVSRNSVSSSLLEMLPLHAISAPQSKYFKKERVKVKTLDSISNKFKKYKNILLKIDAQGYESYILDGGWKFLKSDGLRGILTEVSFDHLYKDQKTFNYINGYLTKLGFSIWTIEKGFLDNKTGKTLQADLLMYRSKE